MESLRALPVAYSKKRRLSLTVAAGRSLTSSSSRLLAVSSALSGLRSSVSYSRVAFDGREANFEEASGCGLGHASFLEGSDDPNSQIF